MLRIEETIVNMCAMEHEKRLIAEYQQLCIRLESLTGFILRWENFKLTDIPVSEIELLRKQKRLMREYRLVLRERLRNNNIDPDSLEV